MDVDELRQYIKDFSLEWSEGGDPGYDRILLQLFGFLGHGKSSFINSCKYVLDDEDYINHSGADKSDAGRTTARISYKLTDSITLVDNRGCGKMDGYETGEIFAQLGNLLPLDVPVEWSRGLRLVDRIVDAESDVRSSDFVFPLFLYSIKKGIHKDEVEDLRKLLMTAKKLTGIFPIVVLTYKTFGSFTTIEGIFRNIGVERIFALENYTPEDHLKTRGRHEAVLKLLYEVIKQVEFLLQEPRDPIQEVKDRKQLILRFICEREMENQKIQQESTRYKEERKKREDAARLQDRAYTDHKEETSRRKDHTDHKVDTGRQQDKDHNDHKGEDRRQFEEEMRRLKEDMGRRQDRANTDHEEGRRHFEEDMRRLREDFEFQRQMDMRRHEAEVREYQRQIDLLKKKENCVIQ